MLWRCRSNHIVTPEMVLTARKGLVWLSQYTAYTGVCLYNALQLIVFEGATIAGLGVHRANNIHIHHSHLSLSAEQQFARSFRRSLYNYAVSVTGGLLEWVFRC